jgi:hypothetical protein
MKPTLNHPSEAFISPVGYRNLGRLVLSARAKVREYGVGHTSLVVVIGLTVFGHTAVQGADVTTAVEYAEAFSRSPRLASAETPRAPKCSISGTDEITITCDYPSPARSSSGSADSPRIALNHAVISFDPTEEGMLDLALTFAKEPADIQLTSRPVYFEIDDDSGRNYVRRLTVVDFSKLTAQPRTFSEKMNSPILPIGHFIMYLWIPDPNPALRFDRAHNFLLNNPGVSDAAKGLNKLADLTVTKSKPHMRT